MAKGLLEPQISWQNQTTSRDDKGQIFPGFLSGIASVLKTLKLALSLVIENCIQ